MRITVPGDKSLTQRALILASIASGTSSLRGLLFGGDAESTANALRAMGANIPPIPQDGGAIEVEGVGLDGLATPDAPLDLGNSGTGTRLLLGLLAGAGVGATLTGDTSLQSRPMKRVTAPLCAMGASFEFLEEQDRLPLTITSAAGLSAVDWPSHVASAQVKSAILLAGLTGHTFVQVTEPRRSRDHSERMLNQLGVSVISHAVAGGWRVELRDPPAQIEAFDFAVPGDISSAAFVLSLAALGATQDVLTVEGVGLNPTRTAFLDVLRRMGVDLNIALRPDSGAEPVGTISAESADLRATVIAPDEVPRLIDELPLVAILGARAKGTTIIRDASELRTKESDRISALVENLRGLGVSVEEFADGLAVEGSWEPLSGRVKCFDDHRIAMAFGVLGAQPGNSIEIDDPDAASVSFPGFWEMLHNVSTEGGE
ncbi:MAG: 3-phosphoshikimate 1-carboxyvinyltransferase [Gemmatimonadales bacterium]|nr:3-phosphoshikimate 1-carboxyvinyltransferase [Gemmatimonadales bacterium]MBT6373414.1 3-phosphoshikimate 1-carboxyvinyltransferase [Gemmatimonadales bacterium]MBT6695390.1 3-phosphoshikimate 1-carboxyvinyltransferase [Gemmatimonadales bacterium]